MSDLSNTPYRSYKKWVFQGGTSTPFILTYGDKRKNRMEGQVCQQLAHIIDILPTCMALGQAVYPERFEHADLPGRSLLPAAEGKPVEERTFYFEHQSSCGIIDGHWKLVKANRNAQWELIDLDKDPFETNDLARQYPERWRNWRPSGLSGPTPTRCSRWKTGHGPKGLISIGRRIPTSGEKNRDYYQNYNKSYFEDYAKTFYIYADGRTGGFCFGLAAAGPTAQHHYVSCGRQAGKRWMPARR